MAGVNRHNTAGTAGQGQSEGRMGQGQGLLGTSSNSRYASSIGSWEPTTVYLVGFVILEIAAYAGLRYAFRGVHGG
jgi:hypothetical protein